MSTIPFDKKQVRVIAHRGLSGIEAENTNAAFVAAGNRSYYGIETDVRRTADGQYVINHDGNLSRIAGVDMTVETSTLQELQNVVLLDKDGAKSRADLRVPTLKNYLDICQKYGKHSILELKAPFSDEQLGEIIDEVRKAGQLDDTTFISFYYENLLKIRQALPQQSVQFLFGELTEEIEKRLIADHIDVDAQFGTLTPENIRRFHDEGLKVNCWTVDHPLDGERLASWGVDLITSNIPE